MNIDLRIRYEFRKEASRLIMFLRESDFIDGSF